MVKEIEKRKVQAVVAVLALITAKVEVVPEAQAMKKNLRKEERSGVNLPERELQALFTEPFSFLLYSKILASV